MSTSSGKPAIPSYSVPEGHPLASLAALGVRVVPMSSLFESEEAMKAHFEEQAELERTHGARVEAALAKVRNPEANP